MLGRDLDCYGNLFARGNIESDAINRARPPLRIKYLSSLLPRRGPGTGARTAAPRHFTFGPRGSTVSGRQTNVTVVRSTALPTVRCLSFFASSHRDFVSHAPTGSEAPPDPLHSTHAHSAQAVAAQVSRKSATSSEALRPSRIIACPPRRLRASRGHGRSWPAWAFSHSGLRPESSAARV